MGRERGQGLMVGEQGRRRGFLRLRDSHCHLFFPPSLLQQQGCKPMVIHRDLKLENVVLSEDASVAKAGGD